MAGLADFLEALLRGQPAAAPTNIASPLQAQLAQAASDQGTAGPVGTADYQSVLQKMFQQPQTPPQAPAAPGMINPTPQPSPIGRFAAPSSANNPPAGPTSSTIEGSGRVNGLPSGAPSSASYAYPVGDNGNGGGVTGFFQGLRDLFDPEARDKNITIGWLQKQGLNPGEAALLAADKTLLRSYLATRMQGNDPQKALNLVKTQLEIGNLQNPTTDDIKEYQFAKKNGNYSGTFQQWMLDNKRAGATNISDIGNTRGETTYDQTVGKNLGEKTVSIMDSGMQAASKIGTLNLLKESLANVYQGAGGDTFQNLRRIGQSLGFKVDNVGDGDLAQSISRQMALQLRDPSQGAGMPGAMSDADREYLMSMVPSLSKTPQGNAQLIDMMIKMQQRNQDVAQMARTYMAGNNGRLDYKFFGNLADWTKANPLFPRSQDDQERRFLDKQYRNGSTGDSDPTRVRNPAMPGANAPVRAINPRTGQRIELQNGKWVPVQ
jgi:hypothetical protein